MWSVRSLNVSLQEGADGLLDNGVNASLLVLVDLVEADVVLAVACVAELRHGWRKAGKTGSIAVQEGGGARGAMAAEGLL